VKQHRLQSPGDFLLMRWKFKWLRENQFRGHSERSEESLST